MLYHSEHVRVAADDGSATLWLDFPGTRLTGARVSEIGRALDAVRGNPFVESLVVRSARPAGFCLGHDPNALAELATDADARAFAAAGQVVFDRLAAVPFPTVALIEGPCLGPGLELALACDFRLAVATPTTELGFPEIPRGWLPCWGGITRLTRLLGPRRASAWLDGSTRPGRGGDGVIDDAFTARRAKVELRSFLDRLHDRPRKRSPRRGVFDQLAARVIVRDRVPEWVHDHYPARVAALQVLRAAARSPAAGLAAERAAFAVVAASAPAAAGVAAWRDEHAPPRLTPVNPVPPLPAVVGLVGADAHTARLAADLVIHGTTVVAADDIAPLFRDALAGRCRGRLTPLEHDQAAARVRVNALTDRWAGFDRAGWIVVSIGGTPVRLPEVEAYCGPRAVIAVAGRPLRAVQWTADRPGRVVGLGLPLVPGESTAAEVGRGADTSPDAAAACAAWLRALNLVPVVVGDGAWMVARRVVAAYWDEAARQVAEGVPIDTIDAAAAERGLGWGPLVSMDRFGLAAAAVLVPRVRPLVAAGLTGLPDADGFYHRPADNPPHPNVYAQMVLWDARQESTEYATPSNEYAARAADRLVYRAVNEAAAALAADRFAGPADVDLAVSAGGRLFLPHGGPLRFADSVGIPTVVRALAALARLYGDRFAPHPELSRRAVAGERFHDARPTPIRSRAAA